MKQKILKLIKNNDKITLYEISYKLDEIGSNNLYYNNILFAMNISDTLGKIFQELIRDEIITLVLIAGKLGLAFMITTETPIPKNMKITQNLDKIYERPRFCAHYLKLTDNILIPPTKEEKMNLLSIKLIEKQLSKWRKNNE